MPFQRKYIVKHTVSYAVDHSDEGLLQIHVCGCEYGALCLVADWLMPMFGGIDIDNHWQWYRENGKLGRMNTLTFTPGGKVSVNEKDAVMLFEARLKAGLLRTYPKGDTVKVQKISTEKLINM